MILSVPDSCVVETPEALAEAMVAAVAKDGLDWIDPCVGSGVFPRAILKLCKYSYIHSFDIDAKCWRARGLTSIRDFLDTTDVVSKVDVVVGNPPYIPLSKVSDSLVKNAVRLYSIGLSATASASYWLPFLLRSLELLREGGNLALVLPAAFEYANYAREAREEVPKMFRHFEVHRSLRPLFDNVSDGCIVIIGIDYGAQHKSEYRFDHEVRDELISALKNTRKTRKPKQRNAHGNPRTEEISSIVDVGIGAVTGDANYFLMTESQRINLGIDLEDCLPMLSRSNQIRQPVITERYFSSLLEADERCWLFKPRSQRKRGGGARAYLKAGKKGQCKIRNYKVSNRKDWFDVPVPNPIHGVFAGMFSHYPRMALVGKNQNCSNTLYWFRFKKETTYIESKAFLMGLYTTKVSNAILSSVRRYPDGLLKLEPSQFKKLPLVSIDGSRVTRKDLNKVHMLASAGKLEESRKIADSFII